MQGFGAVGYHLCELLAEEGASLTVTDINEARVKRVVSSFSARRWCQGISTL